MDKPIDAITLMDAAKYTGKSIPTIRRWRREKGLLFWREGNSKASKVFVSKSDVLSIAQSMNKNSVEGTRTPKRSDIAVDTLSAMQSHIAGLESQIRDLQEDKKSLRDEITQLRSDRKKVNEQLLDCQAKSKALADQLNGKHKGLLARAFKVVRG